MKLEKGQRAKVWVVYRHDGIASVHATQVGANKMAAKIRVFLSGPSVRVKGCWIKK